jgi:signal transduction histidine kinase
VLDPPEDEALYPIASILVVDDRPANLVAMEALLEPLGQRVVTALSGEEALLRAASEEFAVILIDVHMPTLDGFDTVARLRKEHPSCGTPVLFMSAVYDRPEFIQRGYALGAVDYLVKPNDPDLLRAKVESFVSMFRRGRELKRRAELIKEKSMAAERAETASRLKDIYLGIIGHDLRNPLGVIGLAASRLRALKNVESSAPLIDRIDRAVARADSIVADLLDFTRGELGGGIPVTRKRADFGDPARAVVHEMRMLYPDRKIDLALSGDLVGQWDSHRVEQALGNLVTNALDHGAGGVFVQVRGAGDAVTVSVHNGGSGIPLQLLPTLFQPFQKAKTSGRTGGLGLGLYIVREIVRAHGGDIEAQSSLAEGTTFVSTWPRG